MKIDNELYNLTVTEAAAAIKEGALTSEQYASALLCRAEENTDLDAFITMDRSAVLQAALKADKYRLSGNVLGPLHGVPIAVKDSMNTHDLPTSAGTQVLSGFRPSADAAIVASLRNAGAIIFGKNNLVEMSYGLTGSNEHHGQAKNPYDKTRMTGGSSSGGGASVAARLVPAALGGDTVGSIRVPASFCGIVGFRPSTGRWSGEGLMPISNTLDTAGPMARSVEDCALIDSVIANQGGRLPPRRGRSLSRVRLGIAPRQHLDVIDSEVDQAFRHALAMLRGAGAEIVEIDLGEDFMDLAARANWPIFYRETMPQVKAYLDANNSQVGFEEIYEGLGSNIARYWRDAVVLGAPGEVSQESYLEALHVHRPKLIKRYADTFTKHGLSAILYPTTPAPAAPMSDEFETTIAEKPVSILTMCKNTFPSSCAGLPGITIPMGLNSKGLPLGLEVDSWVGDDSNLLDLAALVAEQLEPVAAPFR